MEDIVEKLLARKNRKFLPNWRKGLKCPECGADSDRPKCMMDFGPGCPRLDPDEYEPEEVYYEVVDPLCEEAAHEILRLRNCMSMMKVK